MMLLFWKIIFGVCAFCLSFKALAGPCEEVAFSDPESFAKAMTEGLTLREGQSPLMALYLKNFSPHPEQDGNRSLKDMLSLPSLAKPSLREQILEFAITERESPKSLKDFVRSFNNSAGQIQNNLFQIEANLGFYMKLLGFSLVDTNPHLSKEQKKALKKQQKEDFIAYLDTTPLNQDTRDFIKDRSFSYRKRTIALYRALEEIRDGNDSQIVQRISQAMANLVHIVGFGNESNKALLKSPDPRQSYEALRNILNERDQVAFELGFEGHFKELKTALDSKIPDESKILQQIHQDIQNQPHSIKGKEVLRLRALSLQESPFRGCFGGDCATRTYFRKALDPNFLYFTLTDSQHRSSGHVTLVLGEAKTQGGQKVKTAFVDKIQGVSPDRLKAMLEGMSLSLSDKGYVLAFPKEVGDLHTGLSNEMLISSYVEFKILPHLSKKLKGFRPHKHEYEDLFKEEGYSRANAKFTLLVFEPKTKGATFKDASLSKQDGQNEMATQDEYTIQPGPFPKPKIASSALSVRSLYEPILILKDSKNEEEQLQFLHHLIVMRQIKELDISDKSVKDHLDFVLNNKDFSFKVRKQALYTLFKLHFLFELNKIIALFSKQEQQVLAGEMSNWTNTVDWRNIFIKRHFIPIITQSLIINLWKDKNPETSYTDNIRKLNQVLVSPWGKFVDKETLLISALNTDYHIKEIRVLLNTGANPNAKNSRKQTALMQASEMGFAEIVSLLLTAGADVHVTDDYGDTALMQASKRGHAEIISLLVNAGANVNAIGYLQKTALMRASEIGHAKVVSLLLEAGANVNAINIQGETALIIASEMGHAKVVSLLLEAGANVNAKHRDRDMDMDMGKSSLNTKLEPLLFVLNRQKVLGGPISGFFSGIIYKLINTFIIGRQPALMQASKRGHAEVVSLLLKAGANPNAKNSRKQTALIIASKRGHAEAVSLLVNAGANVNAIGYLQKTALMEASEIGHAEVVSLLLKAGADVNVTDKIGITALMQASEKGHAEVVSLLLKAGANPNAKNTRKRTALIIASEMGHAEVVSLLLKAGADVNVTDKIGTTALMEASLNGRKETVQLLLTARADVNVTSKYGQTALIMASLNGHAEVVSLLLKAGANPNAKNIRKRTALIMASLNGHAEVVSLLLEAGADVNVKDEIGITALMEASLNARKKIVRLLLTARADVNAISKHGQTAYDMVSHSSVKEYVEISQLLKNAHP